MEVRLTRRSSSELPDSRDGGIEGGIEAVTIERLEQTVETKRDLAAGCASLPTPCE